MLAKASAAVPAPQRARNARKDVHHPRCLSRTGPHEELLSTARVMADSNQRSLCRGTEQRGRMIWIPSSDWAATVPSWIWRTLRLEFTTRYELILHTFLNTSYGGIRFKTTAQQQKKVNVYIKKNNYSHVDSHLE